MKILMTGATGFVGTQLSKKLLGLGHELVILTRNNEKLSNVFKDSRVQAYEWKDTSTLPPAEAIAGINGVINLMGENIAAKRWSDTQKKKLRDSRVESTKNLTSLINSHSISLDFFVSASAVGIYPVNRPDTITEESTLGNNFLANLCKEWESAAKTINNAKRVVIVRTAVVLGHGGALEKMLPPFKLGLGGPIGDGDHVMSWIHLDDLVDIYTKAATDSSFEGIYNAAAPHPVDNFHFTKALGKALHKPTLVPVPKIALKIAFGEMSGVILDSQKIISNRYKDFKYETIESALNQIFEKK